MKTVYHAGVAGATHEEKVSRRNLKTTVDTGLYYYGARYYDPKVSIWLSVDPLAHEYPSLSPYTFVANNPIMLVDPDGRHIDPSELMKSEDYASAFILFAKTDEGKAFLDQFASNGQELSYDGEVYYKAGEAGSYDKMGINLNYAVNSEGEPSDSKTMGDAASCSVNVSIGTEGFGFGSDKTMNLVKAIGHESFLHVGLTATDILDGKNDNSNIPRGIRNHIHPKHQQHEFVSRRFANDPKSDSYNTNMLGLLMNVSNKLGRDYSKSKIQHAIWDFTGSRIAVDPITSQISTH